MTVRQTVAIGGGIGLAVPVIVLVLLWRYGIIQIMFGNVDLRAVLWPSSIMLTVGWCCTVPGILITISSVAINCVLYATVALLSRAGIRLLKPNRGAAN
jgi:hypothetical protein